MDESTASSMEKNDGRGRLVPLSDLRVFELKEELAKRGLDRTGIKVALIERLLMAIRNEGHDPETCLFSVAEYSKEAPQFASSSDSSFVGEARPEAQQSTNDMQSKDIDRIETRVNESSCPEDPLIGEGITDMERHDENGEDKDVIEGKERHEKGGEEVKKEGEEKTDNVREDQIKSECETTMSAKRVVIQEEESVKSCSVWVRGIGANVKASDLKTLFQKCGRVVSAKIFIRRQQPTNIHVGFVTMINAACAERCVQFFNKAAYNGDLLTIELADKSKTLNVLTMSSGGKGITSEKSAHPTTNRYNEKGQTDDREDASSEHNVMRSNELKCEENIEMDVINELDNEGKECAKKVGTEVKMEHGEEMAPNLESCENKEANKMSCAVKLEVDGSKDGDDIKANDDMQEEKQLLKKCSAKEASSSVKGVSQPQLTNALLKSSQSLWIRGIGADTKAAHLKTMFSKCGRVVTAKVFVRRQKPSNVYFGFISMANVDCAIECVRQFHKAVLNGRQITVERADRVDMAVRIPEVKNEIKAPAVAVEENTKTAEEKEISEKVKEGEKRSANVTKASSESKRRSSEDVVKKGLTKADNAAKNPEHSAPVRQFTAVKTSSERRPKRNIFRGRQTAEASRPVRVQSAIHKPLRPLLATKPARWAQYAPPHQGTFGSRFAGSSFFRRSEARPLFRSVQSPILRVPHTTGDGPHGRSPTPVDPVITGRSGGSFGGYRGRNLSVGPSGSYRRFSRSRSPPSSRFQSPPCEPWQRNETLELIRRKDEGFRLRKEERELQEERDRLRHERERIERERMILEQEQKEREQRARTEMKHAHCERIAVMERERAEHEQQARLEKERAVQERLRMEREHERIRAERAVRIRVEHERERAERLRLEQEHARAERLKVEQERALAERLRIEQGRARAERLRIEQERAAEQRRVRAERERMERERAAAERERLRAERERVEKELVERQRLTMERERAEKERAERERVRLERERAERERLQLERLRSEAERERKRAEADRERVRSAETAKHGQEPEFGRQPDRLKTQMELMERERLELEQLRQLAALTASQVMSTFAPDVRGAREGTTAHQEVDVSRHRGGGYMRSDERFPSYSGEDTVGRYSSVPNAVPTTTSRYETNREHEHGRQEITYGSFGSSGSIAQSGRYDYRTTTRPSVYVNHAESLSDPLFPSRRDTFGSRYDTGRREDESYVDIRHSAIPDPDVSRTIHDMPTPFTLHYAPQSQTANKGVSCSTTASSGYASMGEWSMSGSGSASGQSRVNPYTGCGGTTIGTWSQISSAQNSQRYAANDASGPWLPAKQAEIWGGQQQQGGGILPTVPYGERGTFPKRPSEVRSQTNRTVATRKSFDEVRRREIHSQNKSKTSSSSRDNGRGRSGCYSDGK